MVLLAKIFAFSADNMVKMHHKEGSYELQVANVEKSVPMIETMKMGSATTFYVHLNKDAR